MTNNRLKGTVDYEAFVAACKKNNLDIRTKPNNNAKVAVIVTDYGKFKMNKELNIYSCSISRKNRIKNTSDFNGLRYKKSNNLYQMKRSDLLDDFDCNILLPSLNFEEIDNDDYRNYKDLKWTKIEKKPVLN